MVMGFVQVSFLVLGAVLLADAHLPRSTKWLNLQSPWSPRTYYSQNQVQPRLSHGSSITPRGYNRLEPNRVLNLPQPQVMFSPRGVHVKPAASPVQTPVKDPEHRLADLPVQQPVNAPVSALPQLPSLASYPDPTAWNLVQTPVPAPVNKPVLVPVQESAPSPLPVPVQAPAENSSQNNVPVWNPVQSPLPAPAQNLLLPSGPNAVLPAYDPSLVPVPAPALDLPLPSGPNAVLLPAYDPSLVHLPVSTQDLQLPNAVLLPAYDPSLVHLPVSAQDLQLPNAVLLPAYDPSLVHLPVPARDLQLPSAVLLNAYDPSLVHLPVPAQDLQLPSGPSAVLLPAFDPSLVHLPVPAQDLALPSGPNAVLLPAQDQDHASVPFQSLPQVSGPSTGLGPVHDPSVVPVPAPALDLPLTSGPNTVLLPAQDPGHTSVPVPFQSLPQLSGPSAGLGPAQDPGQAPGVSPALTSSQGAALLTSSQASPWKPGQTLAQTPDQPSTQAPHPALYQDLLKAVQVHLPTKPIKKLMWRFPKAPERPKQAPVHFDLRQPTPVNSVAAACGESAVHVEVKQDFFGNGKLITPSSLTLGGCAATGLDSAARVLIFNSELQACGSVLMMTEDDLIYSFHLLYNPEPLTGTPIIRTGSVNVQIECHYSRKHNVSSNAVAPTWTPYSSTVAAEENLVFTLKLMTDDWKYERPSNQYFLGEFMKIEASLMQFNHVPLRVFVDRCVATPIPDVNAVPRYTFIDNHGCLVDAKITGSDSQFMKRVKDDKLQFQLEVFKFEQSNSSVLYITCSLKVSTALQKTDAEHKACSFMANGWTAADGDDQDCNCCDAECLSRKARSVPTDEDQYFETEVSLGPILVEDDDRLLQ